MKAVDVERIAQWAIREEAKRTKPNRSIASSWSIVERHLELGCRIDHSPQNRDAELAIPHRDALLVSDAVSKLDSRVELDWFASRNALLGDFNGLAGDCDRSIVVSERELIRLHAIRATRPAWDIGFPKPAPDIGPNGKPKVIGKRYGKDRYSEDSQCRLVWGGPTIESVILARASYAVWHQALLKLARSLDGQMTQHNVLLPAAPSTPWQRPH